MLFSCMFIMASEIFTSIGSITDSKLNGPSNLSARPNMASKIKDRLVNLNLLKKSEESYYTYISTHQKHPMQQHASASRGKHSAVCWIGHSRELQPVVLTACLTVRGLNKVPQLKLPQSWQTGWAKPVPETCGPGTACESTGECVTGPETEAHHTSWKTHTQEKESSTPAFTSNSTLFQSWFQLSPHKWFWPLSKWKNCSRFKTTHSILISTAYSHKIRLLLCLENCFHV